MEKVQRAGSCRAFTFFNGITVPLIPMLCVVLLCIVMLCGCARQHTRKEDAAGEEIVQTGYVGMEGNRAEIQYQVARMRPSVLADQIGYEAYSTKTVFFIAIIKIKSVSHVITPCQFLNFSLFMGLVFPVIFLLCNSHKYNFVKKIVQYLHTVFTLLRKRACLIKTQSIPVPVPEADETHAVLRAFHRKI